MNITPTSLAPQCFNACQGRYDQLHIFLWVSDIGFVETTMSFISYIKGALLLVKWRLMQQVYLQYHTSFGNTTIRLVKWRLMQRVYLQYHTSFGNTTIRLVKWRLMQWVYLQYHTSFGNTTIRLVKWRLMQWVYLQCHTSFGNTTIRLVKTCLNNVSIYILYITTIISSNCPTKLTVLTDNDLMCYFKWI